MSLSASTFRGALQLAREVGLELGVFGRDEWQDFAKRGGEPATKEDVVIGISSMYQVRTRGDARVPTPR